MYVSQNISIGWEKESLGEGVTRKSEVRKGGEVEVSLHVVPS